LNNNQPKISISSSSYSFNEESSATPSSVFSIPLSNLENYDQVYSTPNSSNLSNSSSSKSSSSYLTSPTDENGYLVPINLVKNYNKNTTKTETPTKIVTNNHLTRSFSTRSSYQSSANIVKSINVDNHRATICEQLNNEENTDNNHENIEYIDENDKKIILNEYCIKCNTNLNLNENISKKVLFMFMLNFSNFIF
jgi:hypothetical protein